MQVRIGEVPYTHPLGGKRIAQGTRGRDGEVDRLFRAADSRDFAANLRGAAARTCDLAADERDQLLQGVQGLSVAGVGERGSACRAVDLGEQ